MRRPARVGVERERLEPRAGERGAGRVVGVVRVGQEDGVALVGEHERELDDAGLRPGKHRDLALGVELDAVDVAVARGDRLARAREPADRRVAVDVGAPRRVDERLDDVRGRPELGVAAAEVDERRTSLGSGGRDAAEQRDEVLRREPLEPGGPGTHSVIVFVPARL